MRLKEFIITIFIFTVFYILFFIFFDKYTFHLEKKKEEKKMESILDENKFLLFSRFYGVDATVSKIILKQIMNDISKMPSISISNCSNNYQILPYQFVIAILYLEYFQLFGLREVYFEGNVIVPVRQSNQGLITKYKPYFASKLSYEEIVQKMGQSAVKELALLNQLFLIPGVRIIGTQIYYVGDLDENK